jgi:hypothetical protein
MGVSWGKAYCKARLWRNACPQCRKAPRVPVAGPDRVRRHARRAQRRTDIQPQPPRPEFCLWIRRRAPRSRERRNANSPGTRSPRMSAQYRGAAGQRGTAFLLQLKSGTSPPRAGFWAVTSSYGGLLRERGGPPGYSPAALGPTSTRVCVTVRADLHPALTPANASRARPLGGAGCAQYESHPGGGDKVWGTFSRVG